MIPIEVFQLATSLEETALRSIVESKTNPNKLVEQFKSQYTILDNPATMCCYCQELVPLGHIWIIQHEPARVLGVYHKNTMKPFMGYKPKYTMSSSKIYHPHVALSNGYICTNGGRVTAVQAILTGLNPESPYFKIYPWLRALGHDCQWYREREPSKAAMFDEGFVETPETSRIAQYTFS